MDAEMMVRIAGTAAGLLAGAGMKHRTRLDQKALGPAANVGVGGVVVSVASMLGADVDPALAVEIGATTEFVYQGGRSLARGAKGIGRLFRRLF